MQVSHQVHDAVYLCSSLGGVASSGSTRSYQMAVGHVEETAGITDLIS
jgi:hypothetical protein